MAGPEAEILEISSGDEAPFHVAPSQRVEEEPSDDSPAGRREP